MKASCINCGQIVAVADRDRGAEVTCGACGEVTIIPDDLLGPGVVLDDFLLRETLGYGTIGTVVHALQMSLDRQVALLVLSPALAGRGTFLQTFMAEARLTARLNHPSVLKVFAVGQDQGFAFLAMELVNGPSLRQLLEEQAQLPVERALAIAAQILVALDYAWDHEQLAHGDLHPGNVRLAERDKVKVSNFAIREFDALAPSRRYLAPEVLNGAAASPTADIYSLGATLYHMVAGVSPWAWIEPDALAAELPNATLLSPRKVVPTLPEAVATLVLRWMSPNPQDRPATPAAAREELDALVAGLAADAAALRRAEAEGAAQAIAEVAHETPKRVATTGIHRTATSGIGRGRLAGPGIGATGGGKGDTPARGTRQFKSATVTNLDPGLDYSGPTTGSVGNTARLRLAVIVGVVGVAVALLVWFLLAGKTAPASPVKGGGGQVARPTPRQGGGVAPASTTATTPEKPTEAGDRTPTMTPAEAAYAAEEASFKPFPGPSAGLAQRAGVLSIMPFGDELTVGPNHVPGGYRGFLYERLRQAPYPILMVGRRRDNPDKERMSEYNHEGYTGKRIDQLAAPSGSPEDTLKARLAANKPTVILLWAGQQDLRTNVRGGLPWQFAANRLDTLIGQIVALDPDVYILVGTCYPVAAGDANLLVQGYNRQVMQAVRRRMLAGERVALVDFYDTIKPPTEASVLYPNADQFRKVAQLWLAGIINWNRLTPPRTWSTPPIANVKISATVGDDHTPATPPAPTSLVDLSLLDPVTGYYGLDPAASAGSAAATTPTATPTTLPPAWRIELPWSLDPATGLRRFDPAQAAELTIDLGGVWDVQRLQVWNGASEINHQVVGDVRDMQIFTSDDGVTWRSRGVYSLSAAPAVLPQPGEVFGVWWPAVSKIRLVPLSSSGMGSDKNATGRALLALSKLRFYGTPAPVAAAKK